MAGLLNSSKLVVLILILAAVGCGAVAPSTTTMSPSEARQLLGSIALDFSDLPSGYELAEPGTYDSNKVFIC